ncbi:MAG: hypothetical protein JSS35_04555 [Proteobacteria bacterium]|nr:hypothetical protein [Pseudomonadota bacterium]
MSGRDTDLQGRRGADGRRPPFLVGAGLLLAGLGVVGLVLYLGDTSAPGPEHVYFALGLTGMAFLSLAGQVLATVGLVCLWRWARRPHR